MDSVTGRSRRDRLSLITIDETAGRPLGLARIAENLPFHLIERMRSGEEAIAFWIAYDDACRLRSDFNNIGFRHLPRFSGPQCGPITKRRRKCSCEKICDIAWKAGTECALTRSLKPDRFLIEGEPSFSSW